LRRSLTQDNVNKIRGSVARGGHSFVIEFDGVTQFTFEKERVPAHMDSSGCAVNMKREIAWFWGVTNTRNTAQYT
jgi:hypothetical protein